MNAQFPRIVSRSALRPIFLPGLLAMLLAATPIATAHAALPPRPALSSARPVQSSDPFAFPKPPAIAALPAYKETRAADGLQVCGEIRSDTVWTAAVGIYTVTCDVHVIAGVTLRIQPGVAVRFQQAADDLIISGALQAVGTADAPILFEPASGAEPGSWGRVAFLAGSTGVLDHARLTYGGHEDGMLYLASERVQVLHSLVQSSADTGIVIQTPAQGVSDSRPGRGAGTAAADQTAAPASATRILRKTFLPVLLADERGVVPPPGPVISHTEVLSNTGVYGGGLYNEAGSPLIEDNTFTGNVAGYRASGGGLHNESGSPTIVNNTFADNYADQDGGGLFNRTGSPIIRGNRFTGNAAAGHSAYGYGGGLCNRSGSPMIDGNVFVRNSIAGVYGPGRGGGAYDAGANTTIQNNVFWDNTARGPGGGLFTFGNATIRNNTFSGNTAESTAFAGGGLASEQGAPTIINNIFIHNAAPYGGGLSIEGGSPAADYNNLWDNSGGDYAGITAGPHDLAVDPRFVDAADGDFHLTAASALIDAGDPVHYPPTDFDGDPRPLGAAPDIGADEFQADAWATYPDGEHGLAFEYPARCEQEPLASWSCTLRAEILEHGRPIVPLTRTTIQRCSTRRMDDEGDPVSHCRPPVRRPGVALADPERSGPLSRGGGELP